jgi:hypothetical protein
MTSFYRVSALLDTNSLEADYHQGGYGTMIKKTQVANKIR